MSINIVFTQDYKPNTHKLFEIPAALLRLFETPPNNQNLDAFSASSLFIKGSPDDQAFLCTKNKTYSIRQQHFSDSLLLLTPCANQSAEKEIKGSERRPKKSNLGVFDILHSVAELVPCIPNFEKLVDLLMITPYKGPDQEKRYRGKPFYSWNDLDDLIPASQEEIKQFLRKCFALEINGFWRFIDMEYLFYLLKQILDTAIIKDWPLEKVKVEECTDLLIVDGIPPILTDHCLNCFAEKIDYSDVSGSFISLSEPKICSFIGIQLLTKEMKPWILSDFLACWKANVPDEFDVSFQLLKGNAIKEYDSKMGCDMVELFLSSNLPTDPEKRFVEIFKFRPKWQPDDIKPYLEDIVDETFQSLE
ncbi:hypothetical protein G9A89_000672, partial [Geosiphon pyriformis]